MDTSPEYINMCRKARELQESWSPRMGDFGIYDQQLVIMGSDGTPLVRHIVARNCIWLPRIDQLISNWTNPYDAIESMLLGWPVEYDETESLEINGIKRVMKLKYNKSWNGEDWI